MKLNPFAFLIETTHFPFARVLRTYFEHKLLDVFQIFVGQLIQNEPHPLATDHKNFLSLASEAHKSTTTGNLSDFFIADVNLDYFTLGLFDYVTLGIPLLITKGLGRLLSALHLLLLQQQLEGSLAQNTLLEYLYSTLEGLFIAIVFLINILPRLILSAVSTFLCIPLVIIINAISDLFAANIRDKAFELQGSSLLEQVVDFTLAMPNEYQACQQQNSALDTSKIYITCTTERYENSSDRIANEINPKRKHIGLETIKIPANAKKDWRMIYQKYNVHSNAWNECEAYFSQTAFPTKDMLTQEVLAKKILPHPQRCSFSKIYQETSASCAQGSLALVDNEHYNASIQKQDNTYFLQIDNDQVSESRKLFHCQINALNIQYIEGLLEINFAHTAEVFEKYAALETAFGQHLTLLSGKNSFFNALKDSEINKDYCILQP